MVLEPRDPGVDEALVLSPARYNHHIALSSEGIGRPYITSVKSAG